MENEQRQVNGILTILFSGVNKFITAFLTVTSILAFFGYSNWDDIKPLIMPSEMKIYPIFSNHVKNINDFKVKFDDSSFYEKCKIKKIEDEQYILVTCMEKEEKNIIYTVFSNECDLADGQGKLGHRSNIIINCN